MSPGRFTSEMSNQSSPCPTDDAILHRHLRFRTDSRLSHVFPAESSFVPYGCSTVRRSMASHFWIHLDDNEFDLPTSPLRGQPTVPSWLPHWLGDPALATFLHPEFYGSPIIDQEFLGFCIEFEPFALRYSPPATSIKWWLRSRLRTVATTFASHTFTVYLQTLGWVATRTCSSCMASSSTTFTWQHLPTIPSWCTSRLSTSSSGQVTNTTYLDPKPGVDAVTQSRQPWSTWGLPTTRTVLCGNQGIHWRGGVPSRRPEQRWDDKPTQMTKLCSMWLAIELTFLLHYNMSKLPNLSPCRTRLLWPLSPSKAPSNSYSETSSSPTTIPFTLPGTITTTLDGCRWGKGS